MSWQAGIRVAGVGVALIIVTASCSAPRTAAAGRATTAAVGHIHAAGSQAAGVGTDTAGTGAVETHAALARTVRTGLARAHHAAAHAAGSPRAAHTASVRGAGQDPGQIRWHRPHLGVYAEGMPSSYQPVEEFGAAVGKRPGIVLFYSGFGEKFPAGFAAQAHAHHAVPLDQIEPTGISIAKIADGGYDAYLKSYADAVRAYGHHVIIGFAHEMNGSWYPWGWTHVSPGTWVRAWQRVVTDFRSQGADNVTWLWTVSRVQDQGPFSAYWPGAAYVNWVGIDGYFTGRQDTFDSVFNRAMDVVHQFTNDPVLISESAIGQRAGQARKISDLLAGVLRDHLRGLVWFDVDQHGGLSKQDWRLEGHPRALAAFRKADHGFV
jgi:mannan endo-1,4-beta-mannosidase